MKVYGNGSFEKRGKESYRFTVVVGYQRKEGGKSKPIKKQKTVRAHGDREARRLLNQWIEELESTESSCDGRSVTLEEYLNKHIRDCEVKGLSEKRQMGTARSQCSASIPSWAAPRYPTSTRES